MRLDDVFALGVYGMKPKWTPVLRATTVLRATRGRVAVNGFVSIGFLAMGVLSACSEVGCEQNGTCPAPSLTMPGPASPDPTNESTGPVADALVEFAQAPGTEISEVRASPEGFVLYCNGIGGLRIVDARNANAPVLAAQLGGSLGHNAYPRCQHVAIAGSRGYFTNRGDELQPIPFISALNLQGAFIEQAVFTTPDNVSIEGIVADTTGRLFAAAHAAGVLVLDDQGSTIVERSRLSGLTNPFGLALDGNHLVIADGLGGIAVADVSDPQSPALLGEIDLGAAIQSVDVDSERHLAFGAAGAAGVVIIDVSTPSAPVELARFDTPGSALQVTVMGQSLLVAAWNDVRVLDVSDPLAPSLITSEEVVVTNRPFSRVLGAGAITTDDGKATVFVGEWSRMPIYHFDPSARAPDVRFSTRKLDLFAETNSSAAGALIVQNEGQRLLQISGVTTAGPFTVSPVSFDLQPGEQRAVEVVFTAPDQSVQTGTLQFCTNDPDEDKVLVGVNGNPGGRQVGDALPSTVVELLDGRSVDVGEKITADGDVVLLAYFATF